MSELPANPVVTGDDDAMARFREWFWTSDENTDDWREEDKLCRRFVDGHQWDDDVLEELKKKKRPALTFNRIGPVVDAVMGLEIATRQETAAKPRGVEDAPSSEVIGGLIKWMRDRGKAADAESEATRDMVIGGLGWTDTQVVEPAPPSLAKPQGGALLVPTKRVDPQYVWYDHAACERNMVDARYVFMAKDLALEHAMAQFPPPEGEDWDAAEYDADWAREGRVKWNRRRNEDGFANASTTLEKQRKGLVTLVEVQWYEYTPGASDLERREMRAMLGARVLKEWENPVQGRGFSLQAITGKRDVSTNGWYGVVRSMIQPQEYANVFTSKMLHIVNTQANGGLLIEQDAVEDIDKFNQDYAKPDMNVEVALGSISGGRIQPKPQVSYPAGLERLLQLAMDAPYSTTGISPEMLGIVQREQAGVLEESRKQASTGILAWLMDSARQHRQEYGEYLLGVIKAYVPPEMAIRVLGPSEDTTRAVQEAYAPGVDEYDIVVDESPQSPNQKERSWLMMQPLLPYMIERAPPEVLLEAMKYSPLPATLVSGLEKAMKSSQDNPEQQAQKQQQMEMMQLTMQKLQAEVAKLQADAQLSQARAQGEQMSPQIKGMEAQAKLISVSQPAPAAAPAPMDPLAYDKGVAEVREKNARADKAQAEAGKAQLETMLMPQEARQRQSMDYMKAAALNNRGATNGG